MSVLRERFVMISLFFCDFRSRLTDMGVGCRVVFWGMVNGFVDGVGGDALVFDISDIPIDVISMIGHNLEMESITQKQNTM